MPEGARIDGTQYLPEYSHWGLVHPFNTWPHPLAHRFPESLTFLCRKMMEDCRYSGLQEGISEKMAFGLRSPGLHRKELGFVS